MEPTVFLLIFLACYFIPSVIAYQRKVSAQSAIGLVNLFLGWTVVFWVVALIWACTARTAEDDELRRLQIEALKRQGGGQ